MSEPEQSPVLEVRTRLTRSNFCRTFCVDGVWGAITPQGTIHMAVFTERWNIPNESIIGVSSDGRRLQELPDPKKSDTVIIREIEADISLTEEAALFLIEWLSARVAELRKTRGE